MNVNRVILVGRLTRDPDVRTTQSGQTVATIGMATNHRWVDKTGQKQEKSEFHTVVLWGRLAEVAGQYLAKGMEAFFEGRLQTRSFVGKDGVERKTTEIVGESMQIGSRPQGGGQGGYAPRQGARPAAPAAGPRTSVPSHPGAFKPEPVEEEIPTINLDDEKEEVRIEDVPF
ncbi:MAG: single-stranded DNA-binding protein [Candidatus Moranbacteria bacterium]|nr:single-stranded DNA-binding protein [Candidatus Moranbacteria bacterium]NTW46200.1 single-stranded DNA-binding protein [Candidatus Moranbacteria bacterium]